MTTIVVNSESMASDSSSQTGKTVFSSNVQKIFRIKGCLVGVCGSIAESYSIVHDLKVAKEAPIEYLFLYSSERYDGASILILEPGGQIWCYDGHGVPYKVQEEYVTVGTGGPLARAALMAGATMKEAVQIAIKLDTSSNGRVKYVKL